MTSAHEVARLAGVSVSTVSRALGSPDLVAPATRERVTAAAAQLDYRPNPSARGLRLGRTHTLGLVVPDLENPFFTSIVKAVEGRARYAGYSLIVADSEEEAENEPELVATLRHRTDGVVLASLRSDDDAVRAMVGDAPAVVVNRYVPGLPSVTADDADGAAQVFAHLRALGHRRIAVGGGPETSRSGLERLHGLRAAAARHDDVELIELGSFPPYYSGGAAVADLAVACGATAVIAHNDVMAAGIVGRARDRGIDVPGDLSVAGFDDSAVATVLSPALTTVRVPRTRLGRRAVDLLVAQVEDRDRGAAVVPDAPQILAVDLVIRGSSAEPAQRPTPSVDAALGR
ncbi:transcriptional regulator, LacI family [Xylanimonas cellulosilytica DSM 15894]|uniref:Transcriptional regulator, LacI family n=1 Tax=Xylanimonas cellulosilytica (strain DSM 15894 / JCM 12276 / CECT 5975 / KCTC 9989 / LMG 20990 / NBRC 107835 / XIL07) TaxID=446471 RepID=D1BXX6_XYLCX|nr:LacI family DNA-binding transcriptional regulator [Xylanimonas cellulosilytica]ACZ31767.1 transcriptional regulator, LacI family [Xylanimonas cellulosilytica DSM 15894]